MDSKVYTQLTINISAV